MNNEYCMKQIHNLRTHTHTTAAHKTTFIALKPKKKNTQ